MKKSYNFSYLIAEGLRSIFRHGIMSFAAVGVIMACLIIMGSFSLLTLNISNMIANAEKDNQIVAYVDEAYSDAQAQQVGSVIEQLPNVGSIEYVDKQQALEEYKDTLGSDEASLFEGLDENPLRNRYQITLVDIAQMSATKQALEKLPGVAKVSARLDISQGFVTVRGIFSAVSITLIVLLLAISLFIVSNTVKLAMFDRREEIAIMKIVGATNGFIRWPFVVEGLFFGFSGALLAFVMQWGLYVYLDNIVLGGVALVKMLDFHLIAGPLCLVFVVFGIMVGISGSMISMRKFLQV